MGLKRMILGAAAAVLLLTPAVQSQTITFEGREYEVLAVEQTKMDPGAFCALMTLSYCGGTIPLQKPSWRDVFDDTSYYFKS